MPERWENQPDDTYDCPIFLPQEISMPQGKSGSSGKSRPQEVANSLLQKLERVQSCMKGAQMLSLYPNNKKKAEQAENQQFFLDPAEN